MTYLLDTNIISEIQKPKANHGVITFLDSIKASQMHISSITIAAISYGINRLPKGKKKKNLKQNFNKIKATFSSRIIPFTEDTAEAYGAVMARREKNGIIVDAFDTMLIAQAKIFGLIIITRNEKHFLNEEVKIINPFE